MALYENGKRISGIRDFPAYTWAEYHALPVAKRPKVWKCTDRDYTRIPSYTLLGTVSINGGEIPCDISGYTEFLAIVLINGTLPMNSMTTFYPTANNYYTIYQNATYNLQVRFKYASSKFTFYQESFNGWSSAQIALYAK